MILKRKNSFHNEESKKEIFIPSNPKSVKQDDIFRYLQNLEVDIDEGLFTQNELLALQGALYGKFLNNTQKPFFLYHFLPLWMRAIDILFQDNAHPKILELGCGTGTSSIIFALLGAEVVGVDLNADLIRICNKRKRFYENYFEKINANFYQADTFDFPFEIYAPIDAFFSLFAFNLMKPYDILLSRLIPPLKHGGIIIIIDGNSSSLYSRLIPSRRRKGVLTPTMVKKRLEALGCKILIIETHCAIPPFFLELQD